MGEDAAVKAPRREAIVDRTCNKAQQCALSAFDSAKAAGTVATMSGLMLIKNPQFQTITITTTGGTLTMGAVGGAFGTAAGVVVGSAIGVVPALLTFGLSIPAGATVGGIAGLCGGTAIGTAMGAAGGAATGYGAFKLRFEIKNGLIHVKQIAVDAAQNVRASSKRAVGAAGEKAIKLQNSSRAKALGMAKFTKTKAGGVLEFVRTATNESAASTKAVVTHPKFQVSAASAVTGGVAGGVAGGAIGTVSGGFIGAAVGVVPALFTFGLSIPVGAALGSGIGLCTGVVAGGSIGSVGLGVAGTGGYTYRKEIGAKSNALWTSSCNSLDWAKTTAKNKAMGLGDSVTCLLSSAGGKERVT